MKTIIVVAAICLLTACGTVGGAMAGAGKDLGRVGEWIGNR